MFKVFALASLLVLSACTIPAPKVTPILVDAVLPLQVQIKKEGMNELVVSFLKAMGSKFQENSYANICTVSAINENYWLTAAHCVVNVGSEGRFLQEQAVEVVFVNPQTDLAVIKTRNIIPRRVLPVSFDPVEVGQEIIIIGHPFGLPAFFQTRGYVSNPNASGITEENVMTLDCAAAPGNSGSPVIDLNTGKIVSVLQLGWSRDFSPVTAGATTENMRAIAPFLPQAQVE